MRKLVAWLSLALVVIGIGIAATATPSGGVLVIGTWNVRGYPETTTDRSAWFTSTLAALNPDILCVQEIANQDRINTFLHTEVGFTAAALTDSTDGMDNAIFFADGIYMEDMPDPVGFQHPAQEAYFRYCGLDAVIITVHLSWTDTAKRATERQLLIGAVQQALQKDPDVIVIGYFNATGHPGDTISELASSLGLEILAENNPAVSTTYAGNTYDYILVSPDLYNEEAIGSHICVFADDQIAQAVSDHRPVIGVFSTDLPYSDAGRGSLLPPPIPTPTLTSSSCLDKLNSVTYSDFHAIYGIGDVLAQRLVDAQPFASISDLDNVSGIGAVRKNAILDYFCPDR